MAADMVRGTTPDFILTLRGVDLSNKTVYVTLSQDEHQTTKSNNKLRIEVDEAGSTIAFSLTQIETLDLKVGKAEVQVKFIDENGYVVATNIASVNVTRALLERVIKYAGNSPA